MRKLLIATSNPGKLAELKKFLEDVPIKVVSLKEVGISEKVEETGNTFEENAILKAKFYYKLSGLPTLADDGGFEIDALGGEPGIKSHRWVHEDREAEDDELIAHTINKIAHIPVSKRTAQLRLVLALVVSNEKIFTVEEKIRGIIPLKPGFKRTKGFPYRSLLFLPHIKKFYDEHELTPEESKRYNHRRHAVEKLKPILFRYFSSEER